MESAEHFSVSPIRAVLLWGDSILFWMLKPIMVLLWMILLVVLLCTEAVNIKAKGELGTNVTLTCTNRSSDIHWYMEIHSQLRGCIGRSFSPTDSTYCSPDFETKFLILGNRLIIKNFTTEDCGLYFCGRKRNGSIHFVETFRLVSSMYLSFAWPYHGFRDLFGSLKLFILYFLVFCSVCLFVFYCCGLYYYYCCCCCFVAVIGLLGTWLWVPPRSQACHDPQDCWAVLRLAACMYLYFFLWLTTRMYPWTLRLTNGSWMLFVFRRCEGAHKCTQDEDILGCRLMIDFAISSSDLQLCVFYTCIKRGAELSSSSVIRWLWWTGLACSTHTEYIASGALLSSTKDIVGWCNE